MAFEIDALRCPQLTSPFAQTWSHRTPQLGRDPQGSSSRISVALHEACSVMTGERIQTSHPLKRSERISLSSGNTFPKVLLLLERCGKASCSCMPYVTQHMIPSCHLLTKVSRAGLILRAQQMEHRLLPAGARTALWFCCDWKAK